MRKYFYTLIIGLLFTLFPNQIFAQGDSNVPVLDNVVRNNQGAKIFDGNIIYGEQGDALRIAGIAKPGEEVTVFFDGKEYKTTTDQYKNWFVLFSIPTSDNEEYSIEIQIGENPKVKLLTLMIGKEPNEDGSVDEGEGVAKERKPLDSKDIIIIVLTVLLVAMGWILLSPKIFNKKHK